MITTKTTKTTTRIMSRALAGTLALAAPLAASADEHDHWQSHHAEPPAKLVRIVRDATRQFADANAAMGSEYGPFLGCVSGPDHGAMGIHYVNLGLFMDGQIDATQPEALIYEPRGGRLRLVGVEYLVDADSWLAAHMGQPPVLEGQVFNFVGSPNRFGLAAFFELHVWAWRDNPQGAFVDWNDDVSCESHPGDDQ
ncbi:MAG TPA: hypothetical protein VFV10_01270 [Gammaproteobacteria bacterium]|nr:hypothetical protein [Gammaproteobacteria bacterium]